MVPVPPGGDGHTAVWTRPQQKENLVRMKAVYAVVLCAVLLAAPACAKKHNSPTESENAVSGATTGTIKGRISIDWDGNPGIGGATVYLEEKRDFITWAYDTGGDATQAVHGSYGIDGIPPGTYTVVVYHNEAGFMKKSGVVVEAGKTTTVNLQYPG